jgi:acetyl-CoA/propionyl-CoA carboxylase biotin carboxyl carrier protein
MFSTLLVANRGEIAVRILRACRELDIRSVAVYSDADRASLHVSLADMAVHLGPSDPRQSYLDGDRLLDAARRAGAEAIHPGYGFLAENAAFARAVAAAGLTFVGPSPEAIESMGDKLGARRTAASLGIPIVPGSEPTGDSAALLGEGRRVGAPLLVKAAGGGGGRGMRRVSELADLPAALEAASREALAAFGDARVYLERALDRPRHIEVQVLADHHGNVVHLHERECSLQRRFQKIVEEAPAFNLRDDIRVALCSAATRAAQSIGYRGAGSVEFLVSGDKWFFLEMNTRLQVEHPVTEMVSGFDLVRAQIEIAAGQPLTIRQEDLAVRGHAIEARVCAEDPAAGFAPSPGDVSRFLAPAGPGVRCDAGLVSGARVPAEYDSLIAKVIAHACDRRSALARLRRALEETVVLGVSTNIGFLLDLLSDPAVVAGTADTQLIERRLAAAPSEEAHQGLAPELAAAALCAAQTPRHGVRADPTAAANSASPWLTLRGWRAGGGAN